ncbi:hypothetical protein BCR39DRAFT_508438 [Naematelia encephala]|uniref:RanBD1 domain-containing protein n=1 Tax=Naematelia encephala TaxID=71784 RepID=A0A1Y2AFA6_9TREE|nr:hypothetical protein BCR39DRAFT_508438 [Naematelia encephala]
MASPQVSVRERSPERDETDTKKDVQASNSVQHATTTRLKRVREGSLEPHTTEEAPTTNPLVTKKNRVAASSSPAAKSTDEADVEVEEEARPVESSEEGKNVGEVRRKVEKMSYDEGEKQPESTLPRPHPDDDEVPGSAMSVVDGEGWEAIEGDEVEEAKTAPVVENAPPVPTEENVSEEASGSSGEGLKRKTLERSKSSTVLDDEGSKRQKEIPSPQIPISPPTPRLTEDAASATATTVPAEPAPPPKKPQASFSAFSSTSSPFASASSASPFAAATSASPFAAARSASPSASAFGTAATPIKPSPFASSGFGAFSSTASPFASKKVVSTESKAEGTDEEKDDKSEAGPSTFGDALKVSKVESDEEDGKVHMTEQDVHTGEEDEETLYQTRAKLYVMQTDGGWRERGVGAVRLNVRRSDGRGARLVMRAEGVLRLILNVSLYVGMSCLEDGKHVRTTVFEEGEKRFITLRTGSQKAAMELAEAIHEYIPLEASKSPAPRSDADANADAGEEQV